MSLKLIGVAVVALALTGCGMMERAGTSVGNFTANLRGKTPLNAAKNLNDPYFADERRQAVNQLVARSFGRREPYVLQYEIMAATDESPIVRATAIRALNRSRVFNESRRAESVAIFVKALTDENMLVRREAAKALSNLPDVSAAGALLAVLQNTQEDRDVRIAAADALRHYRDIGVARTLAAQLGGREFGIAWQAHASLTEMTKKDLRYDEGAWLRFLTSDERPLG